MPVTKVRSVWESGNLVFKDANGYVLKTLNGANGPVLAKTANATLETTEAGCVITVTDGKTITLPAAATSKGIRYIIKMIATHSDGIIVDGNASETIDGAATLTSGAQYDMLDIICDGTGWLVIGKIGTWS